MKFRDVLDDLLKEMEQHPNLSVEELLKKRATELALSDADVNDIDLSNQLIDDFDKMSKEMGVARKQNVTRQQFVVEKLEQIIEKCPEEKQDILIQAVETAGKNMMEE